MKRRSNTLSYKRYPCHYSPIVTLLPFHHIGCFEFTFLPQAQHFTVCAIVRIGKEAAKKCQSREGDWYMA